MIKLINILHEIKIFSSFFQIAKDEDEESQFYEETDYVGSGLTGYILGKMSYNELARKLGAEATLENDESYSDGGSKVSAEWIIKVGEQGATPQIVRIYDYKGDVAAPIERDEKIIWHVGGNKEAAQKLFSSLGLKFTDDFREAYEDLGLLESLLLEISEKVIKKKFEEYKNQVVNLDYDAVQYYVERFDQIKSGLKSRVQRGDELVLTLLPKELKTEEALEKSFYTDILKWRKFRDLEKLIDGAFSKQVAKKKEEELVNSVETDADLIYSKNGIEIYKGDAEHKCIKYGKDKYYGWCISRPQGSLYGSYRFGGIKSSRMFYFVFDRNRPDRKTDGKFEDPYHAMVIHKYENGTYALTLAPNTGDKDFRTYQDLINTLPEDLKNALKDKENLFNYIPPSKEEIEIQALAGKELSPTQFAELSYEGKQLYVRNNANDYRKLTPAIVKLLDLDLKNEAINNNRKFTFDELKSNLGLVKRYADYRYTRYPDEPLPYKFLPYLKPVLQQTYYEKFEEEYLTFDEIEEYFSKDILNQYIEKQINNLDFLPKEAVKYMTPQQKEIYDIYSKSFSDIEYNLDSNHNSSEDRMAPQRSVKIRPMSTKNFLSFSPEERNEYINFLKEYITDPNSQNQYLAVSLGIPTSFEQNGKLYFITPNGTTYNADFNIIDSEGNVVKNKVKKISFSKDGKPADIRSSGASLKGSDSFYLKPGVDYDKIEIDGQPLELQENQVYQRFKKLAGLL
jgi:hypothetical protein